jgi:mono/diheme cytochrome c family protein
MNHLPGKLIALLILLAPVSLIAEEKGDAAKGKELFTNRCAVCHGASGEGNEAMGNLFKVKMPILGSKEVQSINNAGIKKIVLEGKGKMKPLALSDQELENAIAFLRSLKKDK